MPIRKNGQLTPKQRLFVAEYLKNGGNATQAAISARYSKKTAYSIGQENLKKPEIINALLSARNSIEKREEKALMEAYETEAELDRIIKFNLKDYVDPETDEAMPISKLSKDAAACISEFTTIETPLGSQRKLKFFNKLDAISKKMQRLGLLKETVDHNVMVETYEERRKRLGLDDPETRKRLGGSSGHSGQ